MKGQKSIRMNDFLMNTCIPVTPKGQYVNFNYVKKSFELDGDLLKTMTNYKFNVDHSNPQD